MTNNPTATTSPPAARPQDNYQYARKAGIRAAAEIFRKRGFSPAMVRTMDRPWSAEVAAAMEQQTAARPLHEICEAARRADCGYCCGLAGESCAYSGTGPDGYHVAKFAAAWKAGLITGPELIAVVREARFFTLSTVVYDAPAGAR